MTWIEILALILLSLMILLLCFLGICMFAWSWDNISKMIDDIRERMARRE